MRYAGLPLALAVRAANLRDGGIRVADIVRLGYWYKTGQFVIMQIIFKIGPGGGFVNHRCGITAWVVRLCTGPVVLCYPTGHNLL